MAEKGFSFEDVLGAMDEIAATTDPDGEGVRPFILLEFDEGGVEFTWSSEKVTEDDVLFVLLASALTLVPDADGMMRDTLIYLLEKMAEADAG